MVLLASVLAFCGCISDSESPCDVENVREVTMNFRLAIQREAAKKTRAVIEGHEPGTAAENAVDLQSLKLLLLTQGGVILQDISDIAKKQNDPEADNYSSYIIKATFKEPYFDYSALGGDVKFNIMVLANWPQDALKTVAEKLSALEIENAHPLYVMPAGGQGLVPSVSEDGSVGTGIPMYGFKDFTVSQSALLESTEAEPYDLKDDINLLRSVAKLEGAFIGPACLFRKTSVIMSRSQSLPFLPILPLRPKLYCFRRHPAAKHITVIATFRKHQPV